ncbi:MAG: efflux RND transporter permease subunit, partial [Propionicimonas sp.]|nr:efflux RND transporter permease subunit [Propionicimonas sp.]
DIPVMILALSSDADAPPVSTQATDLVVPTLTALDGVRDVALSGTETHQINVTYDEKKLRKAGIDPSLIGQLFLANATAIPSGTMETGTADLNVQTGTSFSSAADLENLLLQGTDGPVLLKDVATVAEEPTATTSISRVNGRPSLTLSITKNTSANTVSVSHEVKAAAEALATQLGSNASFDVVFDQSPFIEESVQGLSVEGGIGLVMAIFVIMIFLGRIKPTLITAVSIPLALLIALIGLWVGGYTLNILTLGALTAAIGRVVDDSIVVIENIKRHQASGEFGRPMIVGAVKEVAGAITSSTLTTVAVFLPIGLVGGYAGQMFRPFALTMTIALLGSLLVALTVVPVLASWFMRPSAKQLADVHAEEKETNTWLHKAYDPVLGWSLRHRWTTLLLALVIMGGTVAMAPLLKTDFIGAMGFNSLQITQTLPNGTPLATTDAAAKQVEAVLATKPEITTYATSIGGSSGLALAGQGSANKASYTITVAEGSDEEALASQLRQELADKPDLGTIEVAVGVSAASSQLILYVEGSDPKALAAANDQVLAMLKEVSSLDTPTSDLAEARQMLSVDIDEQAAADAGMTQVSIGQAVARAVDGQKIGSLTEGDETLDVYLRSQQPATSVDELGSMKLPVTQLMTINARKDAADKISEETDKLTADAKADAKKSYNDQVKKLKDARSDAKKAQNKINKQLKKANKQLKSAQKKLSKATAAYQGDLGALANCRTASTPAEIQACAALSTKLSASALPGAVYQAAETVSGLAMQVASLTGAKAQAKSGISTIDDQLEALATQYNKSMDSQADQQRLSDQAKDAQKLNAAPLELKDVAEVTLVDAPNSITRVDGVRAATITANTSGGDLRTVTSEVTAGLEKLSLPDGVSVRLGGVTEMQQEAFSQLALAMVVAVAVVYLVMVATFGSLLQPLILLVSIPFAFTGALGLSVATDTPIAVPSMIGMLMLIGIVVTNAIVLIDLINKKHKGGMQVTAAIKEGARLRLRPIVMTALATIFALIPMGMGITGGGVFISKPLAIVVIGGLITSTLLTLILVPVLFDLLENWRETRAVKRDAKHAAHRAAAEAELARLKAAEAGEPTASA